MIKLTQNSNETSNTNKYPYLAIHVNSSDWFAIILSPDAYISLFPTNKDGTLDVSYSFSETNSEKYFKKYEGSITISNA